MNKSSDCPSDFVAEEQKLILHLIAIDFELWLLK